ncbi:MAG: hypothetical protein ACK4M7_01395 [Burkholderiales bacterium]
MVNKWQKVDTNKIVHLPTQVRFKLIPRLGGIIDLTLDSELPPHCDYPKVTQLMRDLTEYYSHVN